MSWAGHKLTDNKAEKGESEGPSLGNCTCPSELASLWWQSEEFEDKGVAPEDLKVAGGENEGLEGVSNKVKELDDDQEHVGS